MESMIERVARAIAIGLGDNFDHAFVNKSEWNAARGMKGGRYRDINEPRQGDYEDAARAAIEAMVEPTAAMLDAGYRARDRHSPYTFEGTTYRAMVKEALTPAPSDTTPAPPPAA